MKRISLNRVEDAAFDDLYSKILLIRDKIEGVHFKRLDKVVTAYFSGLYPGTQISDPPKTSGVQMGTNIKVDFPDGRPSLLYHVKTHSGGRLSSKSTAAKLVQPSELMVYNLLKHLGLGCEVHFCERSAEDVYIATLDASQNGEFHVFEHVSGRLGIGKDKELEQKLCGVLSIIDPAPRKNDWQAVEASVQEDPVAQHFIKQMVALDILTRIFGLRDLLNNPDNFGFVFSDTERPAIKVIDFRVMDLKEVVFTDSGFLGFLAGNGLYDYASSHKTMRFALRDRLKEPRVRIAQVLMNEGTIATGSLISCIERAYEDTKLYLTSHPVFTNNLAKLIENLDDYYNAVKANVEFFVGKLHAWRPE